MNRAHFTISYAHGRHVAHCHCHHPIGAWSADELNRKIQEAKP